MSLLSIVASTAHLRHRPAIQQIHSSTRSSTSSSSSSLKWKVKKERIGSSLTHRRYFHYSPPSSLIQFIIIGNRIEGAGIAVLGRENGAPSWYGGDQQTPVVLDLQIAALFSVFITPTLAFLIVLPGIRRLRAISSLTFLFSMVVGASIMLSIHYPCWHTGEVRIYTTYKAFTSERLNALLGVRVGLRHVNITFSRTEVIVSPTPPPELDYNERFDFNEVSSMELDRTLEKGLPYPILKVIEFLSVDRTGFLWGKQYRVAGYYTFCLLWFAFACWLLQMMVLCVVPHLFCKCMLTVGVVTILADLTYALNVPQHLIIRFPGPYDSQSALQFSFSTCFYATSIAGVTSVVFGAVLWILQSHTSYIFETFLSAYLDEMVTRRGKDPPDPPDPPSCSSVFLLRRYQQHRGENGGPFREKLCFQGPPTSPPSTPMTLLGSSQPSTSSRDLRQVSPISETELLSIDEDAALGSRTAGHGKQSTASSILEDGTAYPFCEDLCMTASSREGSIKSNDGRTNSSSPSWFALPRFKNRPWSGYSTEDVATTSRASTSNAHCTQKALDCEAQTASCESSSSSSGNSSGDE
ncbi:dual oxidase maturation factor domain-containing protein [Ditylenchus destructor]|uniref:Dual oxidase maturation factor domain-containing protein n=1 Tax=Ditylenchus destructor TaxID=166010 RepID=A0AAD4N6E6_9BILA|nr:dual oxidase maturation factor domain-containing protein [Ditylenchus destructor]